MPRATAQVNAGDAGDATMQIMDLTKDPAKCGLPSSSESDSANESSKKSRPTILAFIRNKCQRK